jgi:hypothetical protein
MIDNTNNLFNTGERHMLNPFATGVSRVEGAIAEFTKLRDTLAAGEQEIESALLSNSDQVQKLLDENERLGAVKTRAAKVRKKIDQFLE